MITVILIAVVWVLGMFVVPGLVQNYDTEYGAITFCSAMIWTAFVCIVGMMIL